MKKINRYNELEYAKLVEEHGFQTQYYKYELKLLAKYWKYRGIKPKQRKQLLYEFCEKNIADFDQAIHFKLINSVLAYSSKKNSVLIKIESIPILEHEFHYISSLTIDYNYKKLLFALLVEKKLRKEIHDLINQDSDTSHEMSLYININNKLGSTLLQSAKVPSKYKFNTMIYELNNWGYLTVLEREMIKLNYLDQIINLTSKKITDIHYFAESGLYYDLLTGDKKIRYCEHCGVIMKKKSNNQTKCNECQKSHRTTYINNKQKEKRNKKKSLQAEIDT